MMKKILLGILGLSLLLNLYLMGVIFNSMMMGSPTTEGEIKVLSRDIEVGLFNETNTLFTLPKGLAVKDVSAKGAGHFEPHRFRIIVTSDDIDLVDDLSVSEAEVAKYGEFYSADVTARKTWETRHENDQR